MTIRDGRRQLVLDEPGRWVPLQGATMRPQAVTSAPVAATGRSQASRDAHDAYRLGWQRANAERVNAAKRAMRAARRAAA